MLFRPTVAPARPCRVPREVREFMAPALVLAAVPAAGGGRGRGVGRGRQQRRRRRGRGDGGKRGDREAE